MGSYKDLVNACAQVVGGTHPTNAQSSITAPQPGDNDLRPYWYSGTDAADATGVAGLQGAWSRATEKIGNTPVAMILPDGWEPTLTEYPIQGHKYRREVVYVRVFVGNNDLATLMDQLLDFADLVPLAFDTHMQLFNTTNVSTADCNRGTFLEVDWGGSAFLAVEFRVQIDRSIPVQRVG